MRGSRPQRVGSRAIIAVIALYALCLQAFLGTLAPAIAQPTGPGAILCAEHDAAGTPADRALPCQHPCCPVALTGQLLPVLSLAFVALVWPVSAVAAPIRWDAAAAMPRAPPDPTPQPRGPPAL